ncbi:PRC-barrel domain-containing protein [Alkalihalobacterium chitinilyticum]|uniref:PRC-barrel domain-containing protein n=1 Tax=Alkalihalobacterium chitinilyticum TaxID=2980103 RepID=A0ABT5VFP4_9BACI|nr:PRC-barrel domain-containing protein [Alkalihalobacterium chitinilyticum]MDE5414249.1 PRC-barrel domain-containing protein [Alkalihalobacterium chitinilyticum]
MLHFASVLKQYNVKATDGELGKVKDLYMDDENWIVRYLIVDTLKWLPGKKVLVSPLGMDNIDELNRQVEIKETKEMIKDSPKVNEIEPVSKKHEKMISDYFEWPYYWADQGLWGSFQTPRGFVNAYDSGQIKNPLDRELEKESHLRSLNEIQGEFTGYKIQAIDGEVGRLSDLVIDDDSWFVRYILVETSTILPGRLVLIPPELIQSVDWYSKTVSVHLTNDQIKNAPPYEPGMPFTREYEEHLYRSYGKEAYWKERQSTHY